MSKKERSRGLIYKAVTQTMKISKKTPGLDFIHCTHYICMAGVYSMCKHHRMSKKEAWLPNPAMDGLSEWQQHSCSRRPSALTTSASCPHHIPH